MWHVPRAHSRLCHIQPKLGYPPQLARLVVGRLLGASQEFVVAVRRALWNKLRSALGLVVDDSEFRAMLCDDDLVTAHLDVKTAPHGAENYFPGFSTSLQ